jgi:hypothetical protein
VPNTSEINPFTQGLLDNRTTPNGPVIAVTPIPTIENRTTMPQQNNTAPRNGAPRPELCPPTKNDRVIGIIGNTQGVKSAASPNPNATSTKCESTEGLAVFARAARAAAAGPEPPTGS